MLRQERVCWRTFRFRLCNESSVHTAMISGAVDIGQNGRRLGQKLTSRSNPLLATVLQPHRSVKLLFILLIIYSATAAPVGRNVWSSVPCKQAGNHAVPDGQLLVTSLSDY
jgi:hypothetical protein